MVRAWVVTLHLYHVYVSWAFQCPHGLELLLGLQLAASQQAQFQCPHGLELLRIGRWYCIIFYSVSMPSRAYTSFLRLITVLDQLLSLCVNALSGLYLISTVIQWLSLTASLPVSMPSRAYTSFLRYPFKNLGFMRFPEPVFAGIYQNILTAAVFRAC